MHDYIICPLCSKTKWSNYPQKYKCSSCKSIFKIDSNKTTSIIVVGEIKTIDFFIEVIIFPIVFVIAFIINIQQDLSTSLLAVSIIMIIHPVLFFPKEIFRKNIIATTTLGLYIYAIKKELYKCGKLKVMHFYSSLFIIIIGMLLLFITIIKNILN